MTIHKEGKGMLLALFVIVVLVDIVAYIYFGDTSMNVAYAIFGLSALVFLFFLNFFRNPKREFVGFEDGMIIAPADGTVVVSELTHESEYFNEDKIQGSIFMSVLNVHANWYPTNGKVVYYTHTDGAFMKANLPKSSTENERSTLVIETNSGVRILLRQVAGALARRIVTYAREGHESDVNKQLGFIKFGSRVDLYLPTDAEVLVGLKQKVTANQTVIAKLKK